jgi:hypothetical protein
VKQNAPELAFRARLKWPAFGLAVVDITGFAGFLVRSSFQIAFCGGFPAQQRLSICRAGMRHRSTAGWFV